MAESDEVLKLRKAIEAIGPTGRPRLLPSNSRGSWLVRVDSKPYGPYTAEELKRMLASGAITPSESVCHSIVTAGAWKRVKDTEIFRVETTPSPPGVELVPARPVMQQLESPAQALYYPVRRTRNGIFKWALLGIWSLWFAALLWIFFLGIASYDIEHRLGGETYYTNSTGSHQSTTWIAMHLVSTAFIGAMTVVPVVIVSVIVYFFTTDREA